MSDGNSIDDGYGPGGWREDANCEGVSKKNYDAFFTAAGTGTTDGDFGGNAICRGCTVRRPCLEYALATDASGLWGGTTHNERRRIRRQRGLVAA